MTARRLVAAATYGLLTAPPYADPAWMRAHYDLPPLYPTTWQIRLTPVMAGRLARADATLQKTGYRILLWDGYRPLASQKALFAWAVKKLGRKASRYVGLPGFSDHQFGLAADLTLVKTSGKPVAMPSDFDDFRPEYANPPRQNTCPSNWTATAFANWQRLATALATAKLAPNPHEWWHFLPAELATAQTPTETTRIRARLGCLAPLQTDILTLVQKLVDTEMARLARKKMPHLNSVAVRVLWECADDPDRYGEFLGTPLAEFAAHAPADLPAEVVLFAAPLVADFGCGIHLKKEIRITLLHELGHAIGFDEEDLAERGLD